MKKEYCVYIVLIALVIGSTINIMHLDKITNNMTDHIQNAKQACINNNFTSAEEDLVHALNIWTTADSYTHIFIRHSEIDATTDAFYEALSEIQQKDISAITMLNMAQYHINSILSMEKPTLKSIL